MHPWRKKSVDFNHNPETLSETEVIELKQLYSCYHKTMWWYNKPGKGTKTPAF